MKKSLRETGQKTCFKELKKVVKKSGSSFIKRKTLYKDGVLAGLASFILYKKVVPNKK